jgi:hypothetical protein
MSGETVNSSHLTSEIDLEEVTEASMVSSCGNQTVVSLERVCGTVLDVYWSHMGKTYRGHVVGTIERVEDGKVVDTLVKVKYPDEKQPKRHRNRGGSDIHIKRRYVKRM